MAVYKSLFGGEDVVTFGGGLADKFGLPPFSVFDARSGDWQSRKQAWLSLGIKSELGRGENLLKMSDTILEPDAKKRAVKKGLTYNCGGPGTLLRGEVNTGGVIRKATGTDAGFQRTPNMQGKPDNPEMRISGWYSKLKKGMTKEEIIAEWQAQQTHVQTASLKGGSTYRLTIGAYDRAGTETSAAQTGTSIFDPTLTEMFYTWFVPKGGKILDPFAGGSVRGIVASRLGFRYLGSDLRKEQIEANKVQGELLCQKFPMPKWICCDSRDIANLCPKESQDGIFSCPPYYNLEVYSDSPNDLSNMSWIDFCAVYEQIIDATCSRLKDNRFACFVVGEVRDKNGCIIGLIPETTHAFKKAGLHLYNDAVLLTAVGSLALRADKQFSVSRKLGRCHQSVLIFVKGDPRKAVKAIEEAKNGS